MSEETSNSREETNEGESYEEIEDETSNEDEDRNRDDVRSYERLYEAASPSVVSIYVSVETADGRSGSRAGAGSGFVYDAAGHVVTNQHVVAPVGQLVNASGDESRAGYDSEVGQQVEVRFSEGDWRTAAVVGTDPYTDLAVLRVEDLPADAEPLTVATSNPTPGQRVAALGNPMGLDGTITAGIVSGTNRSTPTGAGFTLPDAIQTDAAINPGNSGGPLVTMMGEVVGVNRAKQGENIGFAISPEVVHRVVPELIENGSYSHSYLNVRTIDVSPTVAEANELAEPTGVLVVDVRLGPASGGVKGCHGTQRVRGRRIPVGGDVIVGVDGQAVRSHEELTRYLLVETRPNEAVTVELIRDGERLTEHVTLGERPRPSVGSGHRIEIR